MTIPAEPKIYHITHLANLPGILRQGGLLSDARLEAKGGPTQVIGLSRIKRRRLYEIEVTCHPGTKVGEYVPFNFCPRSVMLYLIYRGNHPDLVYTDGQEQVIHLEADLERVIAWADGVGVRWAFSLGNAGAYPAEFRYNRNDLQELDWRAIKARDFRDPDVKEKKQAEFLVYGFFPFWLVERIGVYSADVKRRVQSCLQGCGTQVVIEVLRRWYY